MNKTIKKELLLLEDLGMLYPTETSKRKSRFGLYKCHCGNEFKTIISGVNSRHTKSCGCEKGNKKHNLHNHRLYGTWYMMMQRCNNPKHKYYKDYGGRGIKICSEWLDINNFINDMYPTFKDGLSIDRIDGNGNYEPNNCRWVTQTIQTRNTRKLRNTNKSGYRGVSYFKRDDKWKAQIRVDSKVINLGCFKDKIDAAKAYDNYVIDNKLEHTLNFK